MTGVGKSRHVRHTFHAANVDKRRLAEKHMHAGTEARKENLCTQAHRKKDKTKKITRPGFTRAKDKKRH